MPCQRESVRSKKGSWVRAIYSGTSPSSSAVGNGEFWTGDFISRFWTMDFRIKRRFSFPILQANSLPFTMLKISYTNLLIVTEFRADPWPSPGIASQCQSMRKLYLLFCVCPDNWQLNGCTKYNNPTKSVLGREPAPACEEGSSSLCPTSTMHFCIYLSSQIL